MRKFHVSFAFVALIAVMLGSYFVPNTPALWLTSSDSTTQLVRVFLIGLLGAQLITNPPRPFVLRSLTIISALFAISFGIYTLDGPTSPIVDTVLFIQAGLALAITAIEAKTHAKPARHVLLAKV